ncbi:MAG TPA: pantoate--beta-alanine ligase [Stellaceae bacterium]|jgi:pantoate--beta-alanine ligase
MSGGKGGGAGGDALPAARTVAALRGTVRGWRAEGRTVALVPTMGALHEGHLSLVSRGLASCDRVVVSIFVNPTQFGPNEDFSSYPRREAEDAAKLAAAGAHLLFAPTVEEMYPPGSTTTVTVGGSFTEGLCAPFRPGHFAGVATVVAKLLLQCLPDLAIFGEKDWQQLQVIRRMARDLDMPVRIDGAPTVRDPDGLAMSSRNAYLSPVERRAAAAFPRALAEAARRIAAGDPIEPALAAARDALRAAGFGPVEYVECADAETLAPVRTQGGGNRSPARIFAAARLGRTRLIDNWPVG